MKELCDLYELPEIIAVTGLPGWNNIQYCKTVDFSDTVIEKNGVMVKTL